MRPAVLHATNCPRSPQTSPSHRLARQGKPSRSGQQPAKRPKGPNQPFHPTDSPGRANPAGPGGSPQKPEGPNQPFRPTDSPGRAAGPGGSPQKPERPNQPFHPTDSPGRARLAEFRRPQPAEKISIIFSPGMYRGKDSSHPESAGSAGAVRGAAPNFGRGLPPSRQLDTPVLCPPERRQIPGAPPKIPHSTLFSASTISKSRSFLRAVRFTAKEKTTVSTAAHR